MLVEQLDGRSLQSFDLFGARVDGGEHRRLLQLFCLHSVELLLQLRSQLATHLEEGMLEHTAHLAVLIECLAPLLRVRQQQLLDQIRCRIEIWRGVLLRLLDLAVQKACRPAGKSLEVRQRNVVVLVGVEERDAVAEVEEHHTKRPQIVGDAGLVLDKLVGVHYSRLGVGRGEQHLGHLGRAVAGGG
eukprot:scaffold16905_cov58-Phaeocystis_antarctica.AAC.5